MATLIAITKKSVAIRDKFCPDGYSSDQIFLQKKFSGQMVTQMSRKNSSLKGGQMAYIVIRKNVNMESGQMTPIVTIKIFILKMTKWLMKEP